MPNNNLSIVSAYYQAINEKQPDKAAQYLHDHIELISPLDERQGKEAALNALRGFCTSVDTLLIRAQFSKDNQVMLAYDILFPEPIGNLKAAGLLTLNNNLITRIELFYDSQVVIRKKDDSFGSG